MSDNLRGRGIAARPPKDADEAAALGMSVRDLLLRQRWFVREFDPIAALAICEDIAAGKTLAESTMPKIQGRPTTVTFLKWCVRVPELGEVYKVAREIAAHMLEDEALAKARELFRMEKPDSARVSAYNVALSQLRWSAGKRHPKEYSEKAQTSFTVPVTINTSIPLERGGPLEDSDPNAIFTVEATAQVVENGEESEEVPLVYKGTGEAARGGNPFLKMVEVVEQWKELGGLEVAERNRLKAHRDAAMKRRAEGKFPKTTSEINREYNAKNPGKTHAKAKRRVEGSSVSSVAGQQQPGQPEHLAPESGCGEANPGGGAGVRADSGGNAETPDSGKPHRGG
jgi:hypothetical protein